MQDVETQDVAARPQVVTILMTDLVDSTRLVDRLGDRDAAALFARIDEIARRLLQQHNGREIDKTDGFLMLFGRPFDAVLYAIAFHRELEALSSEVGSELRARAGIHLGEVYLRENAPEHVQRGAKPLEVEGLAKPLAARIMSLAQGGQTLLNQAAFDLARRATRGQDDLPDKIAWIAHGSYLLKGHEDPVGIFEIGIEGSSPLSAPPNTSSARRNVLASDEETLGWRPAVSLPVPHRKGWILDQKLGEGGFGEVWLAANRRTGARRVFKFCFDSDRLRSFKRELTLFRILRDALGDRKDIAKLYEVQLEESPFYLETSFTEGGSLLDWSKRKDGIDKIPMEQRLDLVIRTARAVAAAHSVGILHKDIKPANILIYEDEGEPRPRLADFGIGLLTDKERLKAGNITSSGFTRAVTELDSLTGTPMYAPPESQIGRPSTQRGDIYALGVMLYQMIVGDLDAPLGQGWEQDIHDPLLREDIAACVAGHELDRLESATILADRLESLARRRRALRARVARRWVTGIAVVMLPLLAIGTLWGFRESRQRHRLEAAIEFNIGTMMNASNFERGDRLMSELLPDWYEALNSGIYDGLPADRAKLQTYIGRLEKQQGNHERARVMVAEAIDVLRAKVRSDDPILATALLEYAAIRYFQSDYEEAYRFGNEAFDIYEARVPRGDPDDRLALTFAANHVAACASQLGKYDEAERLFLQVIDIREEILEPGHRDIARALNNYAKMLEMQGRYSEAIPHLRSAIAILENNDLETDLGAAKQNLGRCLCREGKFDEAEPVLREALLLKKNMMGEEHYRVSFTEADLGWVLVETARAHEARGYLESAIATFEDRFPEDHQRVQETRSMLRRCYNALIDDARADGDSSQVEELRRLVARLN